MEQQAPCHVCALHDNPSDAANNAYLPESDFSGHQNRLPSFILHCFRKLRLPSTIVLSHVNLLPVGVLLKCWSPRSKLVLFAHGIELWDNPGRINRMLLRWVDFYWAVSAFTAQRIQELYRIRPQQCLLLNNALDPAISGPMALTEKRTARRTLGLPADNTPILFTLARLQSTERYKGYDQVIRAMAILKTVNPELIYCIGGKYDEQEKISIEEVARQFGLEKQVRLLGFVDDASVALWYRAADVYVMPSRREGFGLVFIEAMRFGLPVIAGDGDGSRDALLQGKLGQLVNPLDEQEIAEAIQRVLQHPENYKPDQSLLLKNFSYGSYREKLDFCLKFVQGKHA
jgi:glycosyltransferase involved in cell wall biosynthesis